MTRAPLTMALIAVLAGCAGDEPVDGLGLDLRDPLGLLDDIEGDLELLVLPGEVYECATAEGTVTPLLPERGMEVPEAAVALSVAPGDPTAMVQVDPGAYVISVRGWGTDAVTGRDNFNIATGCSGASIEAGQTRDVGIDLIQRFGEGECGDSILSPDEQCEDGNTTDGDGCTASCRTEPYTISSPPAGETANEQEPAVDWKQDTRVAVAYESDAGASRDATLMLLSEKAEIITMPTALQFDTASPSLAGVQTTPDVAIGGGRVAVAFADFQNAFTGGGDVRVQFFDANRSPTGSSVSATVSDAGTDQTSEVQLAPAVAATADGTVMVVFEDGRSATGVSGQIFAAGSTARAGAAFEVGGGATGGSAPAIAATADGFVVALSAGGDVLYQRFGSDGSAVDATARPVLEDAAGTQDQPTVAAFADGRALVAWRDTVGDGAETAIRARAIGADGAPVGTPTVVNTTTAGAQSAPSAAAGADRFVVVFQSDEAIRASLLNTDGMLALNREADPAPADFEVAPAGASPSVATGGPTDSPTRPIWPTWLAIWRSGSPSNGDVQGRLFPLP